MVVAFSRDRRCCCFVVVVLRILAVVPRTAFSEVVRDSHPLLMSFQRNLKNGQLAGKPRLSQNGMSLGWVLSFVTLKRRSETMFRCCCICLSVLLSGALVLHAAADDGNSKPPTFTDVSAAGPDYQIQGEYTGDFELNGEETKIGFQVIALGDENFRGIVMLGGLSGDGWDGFTKIEAEGTWNEDHDVVTLEAAEGRAEIKDGKVTIMSNDGDELGTLERVERKSPTLGKMPPEGAIVLFNGTTSEKFHGGQMTDDKLLKGGCTSTQSFADFTLHLEFRTPFMPTARSQQRGNSGVYLQNRYEVQILDSFGLEGLNNECGGIYSLHDPNENMCFPPLVWQTYDIDFAAAKFNDDGTKTDNAKITVRHNGVVVHENFELKSETPGGQAEGSAPGPFMLQNHGNPVVFRNVWVVEK